MDRRFGCSSTISKAGKTWVGAKVDLSPSTFDGSSDSGSSSDSKSPNSNYVSDDIDVTGDGEKGGTGGAGSSSAKYIINDSGNLEIRGHADITLILEPYDKFGPFLFKFLKSESEAKRYGEISWKKLLQLFPSLILSVARIGSYFNETGIEASNSTAILQDDYAKAQDRISILEEQIKDFSNDKRNDLQIESLSKEVKQLMELLGDFSNVIKEKDS